MNKIGELIIKYRKEHNITQKELAKMLGVSNTAISKWECGNNLPDIIMLKPLSKILDVPILTLIDCQEEIVIEQNKVKKLKKPKIIALSCLAILLLSIVLITLLSSNRNNEDDNINDTIIYKAYSNDEQIVFDAYIIMKNNKVLTFVNDLSYIYDLEGTSKDIYASKIELRIMIDNQIVYSNETGEYNSKAKNANDLIKEMIFINKNINIREYDFNFSTNLNDVDKKAVLIICEHNDESIEIEIPITLEIVNF